VSRTFAFVQVDVFTDRVFGGNQLAVFYDLQPGALSDAEMQAIALEMNLAETTFVYPPTRGDAVAQVRIYTPSRELPFAGHPTVGTAWVLANRGRLPAGQREVALEEGIGPVPVRIEGDLSAPSMVWMSHRDAEFGEPLPNRAAFAAGLHLTEADLLPDQPVRTGSTGVTFLYVPLRTPGAVDRAEPDMRALSSAFTGERLGVFVFAPDPDRGPGRVYSRMFAGDTIGVAEDSATGSASGPLAAFVTERGIVETAQSGAIDMVSLQGNQMGRPSLIHMRVQLKDGRATRIEVGGGVVPVFEAVLTLPS
jgi:trans-2,3-dihydro-3-hydroxyanthranilate isomerase